MCNGLVGRNGAGKQRQCDFLLEKKTMAPLSMKSDYTYWNRRISSQDPREGDPDQLARDRIISIRGINAIIRKLSVPSKKCRLPKGRASKSYGAPFRPELGTQSRWLGGGPRRCPLLRLR